MGIKRTSSRTFPTTLSSWYLRLCIVSSHTNDDISLPRLGHNSVASLSLSLSHHLLWGRPSLLSSCREVHMARKFYQSPGRTRGLPTTATRVSLEMALPAPVSPLSDCSHGRQLDCHLTESLSWSPPAKLPVNS